MTAGRRTAASRYAVAVISVALAIATRRLLDPIVGSKFPFSIIFFAVLATASYGGLGPALLALVLGGLGADYFVIAPRGQLAIADPAEALGLALYGASGLGISLLGGSMHTARRRAEAAASSLREAHALLESRVVERTAALAASEDRFRRLFEAVPTGILGVAPSGRIVLANAVIERQFGYEPDELIGQPIELLVPERLRALHVAHLTAFVAEPTARRVRSERVLRGLRKDGSELPLEVGLCPVELPTGTLVLGAVVDISERLRSETLQREATAVLETFRLMVESVKDYAILQLDRDGNVVTWNTGAHAIKGYTADEILGRSLAVFYPPGEAATAARNLEGAAARGRIDDEGWRLRKDGSRFWASVVITAIRDPQSAALLGYVKVTRDLTERKRAEDSKSAALAENTALLQEVHHRVKNNLQMIVSLLSMQARQIKDEGARALVLEAQGRVRSIALLHGSLYHAPDLGRVDMREYLDRFVATLRQAYRPCRRIVTAVRDVHIPVNVAVPCGLIINELVTNALKHAFGDAAIDERDEIRIEISKQDDTITLSVADNGLGFPAAVDPSSEATMGLSLIRDLSIQLRARAVFDSSHGVQCTITFQHPRKDDAA